MITHFIEVSNLVNGEPFNYGKFLLARFTLAELETTSALPGCEGRKILWGRKLGFDETLVVDLQTGEGAGFTLDGDARYDLNEKHRIWVCPLYEPFLVWLYQQQLERGRGNITALPRYIELEDAPASMFGYRREGQTA